LKKEGWGGFKRLKSPSIPLWKRGKMWRNLEKGETTFKIPLYPPLQKGEIIFFSLL